MSQIVDLPTYAQYPTEISAPLYNLWRRARLHYQGPIHIALAEMPGIILILKPEEWLCIDQQHNELLLLAWLDFDSRPRQALHLPISCTLNYYHFRASKVRQPALHAMQQALEKRLK